MSVVLSNINEQALQLSDDDKRALIDSLVISLDRDSGAPPEEIARTWEEEIGRRVDAIDKGEVEMIDGEEVFARVDAILARRA